MTNRVHIFSKKLVSEIRSIGSLAQFNHNWTSQEREQFEARVVKETLNLCHDARDDYGY